MSSSSGPGRLTRRLDGRCGSSVSSIAISSGRSSPAAEQVVLGRAQDDGHDPPALGHRLARAQQERDAAPAVVVDLRADGGERVPLRVGVDVLLLAVALELAEHDLARVERLQRLEGGSLGVAQPARAPAAPARSIATKPEQLAQVGDDHVAQRARLLVERARGPPARGPPGCRSARRRRARRSRSARTGRWRSAARGCPGPPPCRGSGRCGRPAPRRSARGWRR